MFEEFGINRESDWHYLRNGTQIHKSALISPWVRFNGGCIVHPYAIIGRQPDNNLALARQSYATKIITIGQNTIIGCHAIIYADVVLGDDCFLGDGANIREGGRIGDRCMIGANVSISYNVKIGNDCRFQNGTVIVGDIHIGDGCFFGVNVTTSNDRNVDLEHYHFPNLPQPSVFGNKVMVGSGSNILAGCVIGDGVIIGAGALVVYNVENRKTILGPPAKEYVR